MQKSLKVATWKQGWHSSLPLLSSLIILEIIGAAGVRDGNLVSKVAAVSLTSLATLAFLINALSSRGPVRLIWTYTCFGCALWTAHLYSRIGTPSSSFVHHPGSDISDVALSLHLVLFTAALLLPALVEYTYFNVQHHLLDLAFLCSFWIVVYAYFVSPFDFVVPDNRVYDLRLQVLILLQGVNFVIVAGLLALRARGIWGDRYKSIFIASLLYALSLFIDILPDQTRTFVSASFLLEQTSALCFVWVGFRALHQDKSAQESAASTLAFNPIIGSVITIVLVAVGLVDSLRSRGSNPTLAYRLNVILASILIFIPLLLREVLRQKERRFRDFQEWLRSAKSQDQLNQSRFQFDELVETLPAIVWRINANTMRLEYISQQVDTILGYSSETAVQAHPTWWLKRIPATDRKELLRALLKARNNEHFEIDHRMITADGSEIWLKSTIRLLQLDGSHPHFVGVSLDNTKQKTAELSLISSENALRASRKRQQLFLEQTLLGVIEWDENFRVREWNTAATEIFGFRAEEVLGKYSQDFLVPSHKEKPLENTFNDLTCNPRVFLSTYGHLHKDGRHLVCNWFNTPIVQDGKLLGLVSFIQDVTEQKLAEQLQQHFGARLLRAQEEERRKIARELHDDIGQDLAILCMKISTAQVEKEQLLQRTKEIAQKVSTLSRQIHSAQLDLLGLDTALRNFCREAQVAGLFAVDYRGAKLLTDLDSDVALCFYRVLQEAIHNANKHSHAHHLTVELADTLTDLTLTISDDGCGFDPNHKAANLGLGLTSMRERMHSLGGELKITSSPGSGTRIEASAPHHKNSKSKA